MWDLPPDPHRVYRQVSVAVLGETIAWKVLQLTGEQIPKASGITLQVLLILLTKAVIKLPKGRCLLTSDGILLAFCLWTKKDILFLASLQGCLRHVGYLKGH